MLEKIDRIVIEDFTLWEEVKLEEQHTNGDYNDLNKQDDIYLVIDIGLTNTCATYFTSGSDEPKMVQFNESSDINQLASIASY